MTNTKPAVFLDRDGTIIKQVHHLTRIEEVEIVKEAVSAVKSLNEKNIPCIVITNQSVVARGKCSLGEVKAINKFINDEFKNMGAEITAFYLCPHYPKKLETENEFQKDCNCRKPKPGLILQAAKDFEVDLGKSWVVGDSTTDIAAGINAKCKTILVQTGYSGQDGIEKVTPSHVVKDLSEALVIILKG